MKYIVLTILSLILCVRLVGSDFETEFNRKQLQHYYADKKAEELRDYIDTNVLCIATNTFYRRSLGFCVSYYYSYFKQISPDYELAQIFPTEDCKALAYEKLMRKHFLFSSLVQKSVADRIIKLSQVNGFNLDAILAYQETNILPTVLNTFIQKMTQNIYRNTHQLNQPITTISFDAENDIHYICLKECKELISQQNLLMSPNSDYLRAVNANGKSIIWSMKTGDVVSLQNEKSINWTRFYEHNDYCRNQRTIDRDQRYMATQGMTWAWGTDEMHRIIAKAQENFFPAIVLFKCPSFISHLCQTAFVNSKGNKFALEALKNSNTVRQLQDFPKKQLEDRIAQELKDCQDNLIYWLT